MRHGHGVLYLTCMPLVGCKLRPSVPGRLQSFYEVPFDESSATKWALIFVAIGVGMLAASVVSSFSFNYMGQKLACRVRVLMMTALLRQVRGGAWFTHILVLLISRGGHLHCRPSRPGTKAVLGLTRCPSALGSSSWSLLAH